MDLKSKILIVLALALMGTISGSGYLINKYYSRAIKAENNLSIGTDQWRDKENRLITEIGQQTVNLNNMKNIFKKDSSKLATDYEKRIYGLKREVEALGIKLKNINSVTSSTISVVDSFKVQFVKKDTTFTASRTDGFMTQYFTLNSDYSMETDYSYLDDIKVLDTRKPKLKENGKKHWPNWGNLPWVGWEKKILWYSNNPKAKYTGTYSLKIER